MRHNLETPFGTTTLYSEASKRDTTAGSVLVLPGYSETITHHTPLVKALAEEGFNATTPSQPRRAQRSLAPNAIARQGEIVCHILDSVASSERKIHIAAHSLGAAAALYAAKKLPDHIESLVLMGPLGFDYEKDFWNSAERAGKMAIGNQLEAVKGQKPWTPKDPKPYHARIDRESAFHFDRRVTAAQFAAGALLGRQLPLAVREARDAGKYGPSHVYGDLGKIQEARIPVHLVVSASDRMIDADAVDDNYQTMLHDRVTSYSSVGSPDASHDTFWLQPQRSARIISQLIRSAA
jgi:pimeloyl-ACP methyl ester carboxylesterase